MKKTILSVLLFVFCAGFALAQDKKEEEVKIKTSAVCKMCKASIERNLAFEKGVKNAQLDVASQVVTVTYNPKKTDITKIKKAINDTGYDADEVPANAKAYEKLDDCCKKDKGVHLDK